MSCSFDRRGMWDRRENETRGIAITESGRMITKDIENMTITEYMEYEAEMKRHSWGYAQSYTRSLGSTTFGRNEEVSSDKDVDEWLNAEMGKRMTGQDKEEEKDALIDILKIVVEECKTIYKNAQIKAPSRWTSEIQGVSFVTKTKEGDNSETLPNWPTCNPDLSFCNGYDAIYGEEESGILKQWICFRDHERHKVGGNGMIFVDFLKVRYRNKNIDDVGMRKYVLDDIWEKCKRFQDTASQWHDEGFEEDERWESGMRRHDTHHLVSRVKP
nr:hypothetical protein [Tanacetum cinerariifolium]